jgi:hypothetical protein
VASARLSCFKREFCLLCTMWKAISGAFRLRSADFKLLTRNAAVQAALHSLAPLPVL